jgi:hypothetical protein
MRNFYEVFEPETCFLFYLRLTCGLKFYSDITTTNEPQIRRD